jgi:hypothetical protein
MSAGTRYLSVIGAHTSGRMLEESERNHAMRKWQQRRNGVPLFAERVYVGRNTSKVAVSNLSDPSGKPRLRLKVDASGEPSLEFLGKEGTS